MLIERLYRAPPIMFIVEPRIIIKFEHTIQSLVTTCLSGIHSWSIPLQYRWLVEEKVSVQEEWLQAQFKFANHLALIACCIYYNKWIQIQKHPIKTPTSLTWAHYRQPSVKVDRARFGIQVKFLMNSSGGSHGWPIHNAFGSKICLLDLDNRLHSFPTQQIFFLPKFILIQRDGVEMWERNSGSFW